MGALQEGGEAGGEVFRGHVAMSPIGRWGSRRLNRRKLGAILTDKNSFHFGEIV
jgi:hypothetical protein